jgi:hypothetical protein
MAMQLNQESGKSGAVLQKFEFDKSMEMGKLIEFEKVKGDIRKRENQS